MSPHPHIGLATVTWLFAGKMVHKDSLGSNQVIAPGDLNWMTAGHGIAHSERSPDSERQFDSPIEGLQFWVAQPEATETGTPRFEHVAGKDLPHWQEAGANWVLVAGEWQTRRAPAEVDSPWCCSTVAASKQARSRCRSPRKPGNGGFIY